MSDENKKSQQSIPASKVERASRFVRTGVKVGGNYLKHYAKKIVDPSMSNDELHEENAKDIYESLSELKGSALKIAQMMSMDKNMLPQAYATRFQMAQYSAPPLSYPLVVRTFQKQFGKRPTELFDTFTEEAVNAASIGQVHQATLQGRKLAVKIQYPGVAESVSSDLRLVKPFAVRIMQLNERDIDHYMEEVETMLLSETDYALELRRGTEIPQACRHLEGLVFPQYFPEYSGSRILTMEWVEGLHLDAFLATNPSQEARNRIGQLLWDFYDFQMHNLRAVHADPHPGNFLMRPDGTLGVIDFGCVKELSDDFYEKYFTLMEGKFMEDEGQMMEAFYAMNFIYPEDTQEDREVLVRLFQEVLALLKRPFDSGHFDFADGRYFEELYEFGMRTRDIPQVRNSKRPRGMRDGLYVNRTYFGLYNMLHDLGASIETGMRRFPQATASPAAG
jgi:predicted unusual protein kinase regulating ubiquinone biosynthesis (AarF/ABC1/UbiB family)